MTTENGSGFPRAVAVGLLSLTFGLFFGPGLSAAEKDTETPPPPPSSTETFGLGLATPLTQAVAEERARAGALAPKPQTWHIFASVGASGYDLDGKLPGKFQEHADVPRGFFLRTLDLTFLNKDSPYMGSLVASEVRERDQRITADMWKVGSFRTQVYWDEIPKFYSNSPTLYQNTAAGVLQVSPVIRTGLENLLGGPDAAPVPGAQPPATLPPTAITVPAAFIAAVQRELSVAPFVEIGTRRETGLFSQSWTPNDILEVHFQAGQQRKHGNIPWGTGTFARQNIFPVPAPYTPGDGVWEAIGAEIPAPIDWRTDTLSGGFRLSGKIWNVGLDYEYQHFRDGVNGVTFDNWFRITDRAGNPAGSAVGRWRQARAQIAYPPSSEFQSGIFRFGLNLPAETQFHTVLAYGRVRQNEQFQPYTLNTALQGQSSGLARNIPPGTLVYDTSSLPQQSLNANVRTINQEYAFVSRAFAPMTFRLQFRSEDLDNNSPVITFPGQARFGDSQWVEAVDYYGIPFHNRPESYDKKNAIATWRWDFSKALALMLEYQFERWDRTLRNVPRSDEHTGRARIDFTPSPTFSFRADYRYSDRKPNTYLTQPMVFNPNLNVNPPGAAFGPGGPGWETLRGIGPAPLTPMNPNLELEFNQLRGFDQGPRKRHDGIGTADVHLGKAATLSGSFRYVRDDYVSIPSTPAADYSNLLYGMLYDESWNASAEFTVTPGERTYLFVNYTRGQDRFGYLNMGTLITGGVAAPSPNLTPCCAQYPITNSWERHNRTTLDSLQTGFNYATPGDDWVFDGSYALSFATEKTRTFNPFPLIVPSNSPHAAAAYPYPNTTDRFQQVLVSLSRRFSKALELGFRYRYERYQTSDFYLNDLSAYPFGQLTVGGVITNVQRYLFLNARYGSYTANEVAGFLRYRY
jgi:hypothetical protein